MTTTIEDDYNPLQSPSSAYKLVQSTSTPVQVSTPRCFYPTNSSTSTSKSSTNPLDFEVPSDYFNMYSFFTPDDNNSLSSPLFPTTLSPMFNYGKNQQQNMYQNTSSQQNRQNEQLQSINRLDDLNDVALDEVFLTQQSFVYPSLPTEPLASVPILTSNTQQYTQQPQYHQMQQQQQQQQQPMEHYTPNLFKPRQHNHSRSISSTYTTASTLPTVNTEITSKSVSDNDDLEDLDDLDDDEEEEEEDYEDEDYDYDGTSTRRRFSNGQQISYNVPSSSKRNSSVSSQSNQRRMSKNAKLFKCDSCPSSFTRKTRLTEHKNRVHLGKVYHFECKICGVRLSSKENLTRHKIVHTDKFKCDKCDRRFDRSYRFHRHIEKCDGSA